MRNYKFVLLFIGLFCFGFSNVEAQELVDGIYKIQSALNNNKVLDVYASKTADKTNVQLYDYVNTNSEKWNVKHVGNGYYTITSLLDNKKSLDVSGAGRTNGTNVQLYSANSTDAQKWLIKSAGNGYFYIISKCNGLYVDVKNASINNNTNIQMYQGNGTNAQKFKFIELLTGAKTINDGTYTITSALNGNKSLDVSGGKVFNKSNVQLYDKNDTYAQIWNVKYLNNGYYSITSYLNSNFALDLNNASPFDGANIQLYSSNNTNAQKWIIKNAGNGYYNIVSSIDSQYVDVKGANTANSTNIHSYHGNSTNAQKFKFNKIEVRNLEDGIYTINSSLGSNKVISAYSSKASNGVNVRLENYEETNNGQKWYIKNLGLGYYSITSALNNNFSLDVSGANNKDGTNVQIYNNNQTAAQKWYIKHVGGNNYNIVTLSSYKTLDIAGGNSNVGTNVQIYSPNNTNAQKFTFTKTKLHTVPKTYSNGYYIISSNLNNNKVIDVSGAKKINNNNVQLYNRNNSLAQIWYIKSIGDGYYSITSSMNPKISLNVHNYGKTNGTNVEMYKYTGTANQQWYIKDLGNDNVSFISKDSGLYLDVASGSTENGTNIHMYQGNNTNAQKFKLIKYSDRKQYMGMDISSHQGKIDWNKVANTNLDFVVIRAGYGGNWTSQDDKEFKNNVKACANFNIPYGIYLYSYAKEIDNKDKTGVKYEADHVLRLLNEIKKEGYTPTLPIQVFLDVEDKSVASASKQDLTDITVYFCDQMKKNGYSCGLYASKTWLDTKLDSKYLANTKKIAIWLAEWPKKNDLTTFDSAKAYTPSYNNTSYKYWQFTSNGSINGISGRIDLDLGYNIFD